MPDQNTKFKGKYRIQSNRLQGWDYASPAYYFITICTQNRIPWFGEIKDDSVTLSQPGKIVSDNLEKIPIICPHVSLDAWIVMPDHIHAVILIAEPPVETTHRGVSLVELPHRGVSDAPHRGVSLGVIINQYKSACTKHIRRNGFINFAWQARYYDHIIRNEKELEKIRTYILGNPIKWTPDEFHSP